MKKINQREFLSRLMCYCCCFCSAVGITVCLLYVFGVLHNAKLAAAVCLVAVPVCVFCAVFPILLYRESEQYLRHTTALRVALLNDSFPPTIDGVANTVVNYARHLPAKEVCVATPAYPNVTDNYPFPVCRYRSLDLTKKMGYRAGLPFSPQLLRTLQAWQPQIIHTHCPISSTLLARMLQARVDAPIVLTYHTKFDIDIQKSIKHKLLQKLAIRLLVNNITACDEIWVVSQGAGENLRSLGYRGSYTVMPNGVDFPRGAADLEAIRRIRQEWHIPTDCTVFLYVGRMMWYKGLRLSLDALRQLADTGERFCFILVGDGLDRPEIEAYAKTLGLTEHCIFTGTIFDREILRALYSSADLFLFPSSFDTNGLVVREAAACGCPSLLAEGSCAAEGVTDNRNGFLFAGDALSMCARLQQICATPGLMQKVGLLAQQELYLSWEDAVQMASARYAQILTAWQSRQLVHQRTAGDMFFHALGRLLMRKRPLSSAEGLLEHLENRR